jgi:hypothetical protein
MTIIANEVLSTTPLVSEVHTDSIFKIPNFSDKALLWKSMADQLKYQGSFNESLDVPQDDSTVVYKDMPDVNVRVPAVSRVSKVNDGVLAAVLQIWEGTVISIDECKKSMIVKLTDRGGIIPAHTGEIDLEWVHQQDADLVKPGAIFYWTIYKETKRGTVKNSEELQFRRLPNWTQKQVEKLYEDADDFLATFAT